MEQPEHLPRRLAVILYADVAGYSRLTGEDEDSTHRELRESFDLIAGEVHGHGGQVMHYAGDAVLAMFDAAAAALLCAAQVQRSLAAHNADVPDERRVQFRIGVNLGDVIEDRGDIYGDGVNVAARLESLAEPGGICVSESVYTAVGEKLPLDYEYLGEQQVKNIAKPVRAYNVLIDPDAVLPAPAVAAKKSKLPVYVAIAAVFILVVGGLLAWLNPWAPAFEPASVERMAYPLPDLPSIAVLPFDNYSDDPRMNYFASGLTEDLTSALSKADRLFVIARNSASKYKGEGIDIKQVAEELGVQYVLEGSVQKAGEQLRITAQLIDALSGGHVWSDRYDREPRDVFALQDEIVARVMVELQVELTEGDRKRRWLDLGTRNLDAWLMGQEAYSEFLKFTRESQIRARELWQTALELEPSNPGWLAGIAFTHWAEARWGWSPSREESIGSGKAAAERAIELGPEEPLGYQALGNLYLLDNQFERGIELRRKAAEIAPNDFSAVGGLALRLNEAGDPREALVLFERAQRLSPKPPWWLPYGHGVALHFVGRKEDAVEEFSKAARLHPKRADIHARLAAVYADLGWRDDAKAAVDETLRLKSNFTVTTHLENNRYLDPERNAWLEELMLRAGLPE